MLCNACHLDKSESAFSKEKTGRRGYQYKCKECIKIYASEYGNRPKKAPSNGMLQCKICLFEKPVTQFYPHRKTKTGYQSICKICWRNKVTAYRITHPKETRALKKKWQNSPNGKKTRKAYRIANAEKSRIYQEEYQKEHAKSLSVKKHIYYLNNKRHIAEASKLWRKTNPKKIQANSHRYYNTHKEACTARNVQWQQANPDKVRRNAVVSEARKRARKHADPINDLSPAQWQEILTAYGHRCVYCGRKVKSLTQDHITPLFKGGSHTASNVVPACRSCNSKKSTGPPLVPIQPLLLTIAPAKKKPSHD